MKTVPALGGGRIKLCSQPGMQQAGSRGDVVVVVGFLIREHRPQAAGCDPQSCSGSAPAVFPLLQGPGPADSHLLKHSGLSSSGSLAQRRQQAMRGDVQVWVLSVRLGAGGKGWS